MIKVICDRCNKTEKYWGVITQQYKYGNGFEELTKKHQPSKVIVDLCKKCFREYTDAYHKLKMEKSESTIDKAKRMIFGSALGE